jgi:uncharacterized protein (TIGR01244 family)
VPAHILPAERAGILLMDSRNKLEEPEKTLDILGLKDGDVVADIGCGNGYYTLRLAKRVAPTGRVLAVDIQQGMLDQLKARMTEAGIKNIEPILDTADDPKLPAASVNWMLLVDVYHEFSNPQAMLAKLRAGLAPGGKIALLEYRKEQDPATISFPIPIEHKMSVDEVMQEWTPAGFELVDRIEMLPAQHIFIFAAADHPSQREIAKVRVGDTPNAAAHRNNRVYFGAQPAEADFAIYAKLGVRTVINLRPAAEMATLGFDEQKAVEAAGLTYLNFPMGHEIPSGADLQKMFTALDGQKDAPLLLHCASSNRVGTVWALYRMDRDKISVDQAEAEGRAAGMKAEAFVKAVREHATK